MLRLSLTATLASLLALPAFADITADDVWSNMKAQTAALGGTLTGTLTRTGETVTVSDPEMAFTFPLGSGAASVAMSGFAFVENGDGSVAILYTDVITLNGSATIDDETGTFSLRIGAPGVQVAATGTPGDVIYRSESSSFNISGSVTAPGEDAVDLQMQVGGLTRSNTRVTEGDLLTVTSTGSADAGAVAMTMTIGADGGSTVAGTTEASEFTFEAALLPNGLNPLNIAAALRDGMTISLSSKSGGSRTVTTSTANGGVISRDERFNGPLEGAMTLDAARFAFSAAGTDAGGSIAMDVLEIPTISFDLAQSDFAVSVPLGKSDIGQPATLAMSLAGFRMGADIWALFDPDKVIPRDPATIRLNMAADMVNTVDLLDFLAFGAIADRGDLPVTVNSVTINDLHLSGSGVEANGTGAFAFDFNDMVTNDGMPLTTGAGAVTARGINGLIDKLIAGGFLTQEDAMGARFGLGMFADVVGEDELRSTLDLGADGSITVNGQRLR